MQNFEDLVVGHFRKHVSSILKACEGYTEGVQVGCFGKEEGNKETCSIEFKNDVAEQIKPLVASFKKIGATMAEDFLHLSEKKVSLLAAELAPTLVLKKNRVSFLIIFGILLFVYVYILQFRPLTL